MPHQGRQESEALVAMIAAPGHHRVVLENDRVRVLDTHLAPGDTTSVRERAWPHVSAQVGEIPRTHAA